MFGVMSIISWLAAWLLMAASTTLTPEQRTLRAKLAANTRWSVDGDRKGAGKRAQAGLLAKFIDQVDPDRILPEDERTRRALAARRAHMQRLAFLSSKGRSSGGAAA